MAHRMIPEWITFTPRGDERGMLVAIEGGTDVPFAIKRVYTLHGFALVRRQWSQAWGLFP